MDENKTLYDQRAQIDERVRQAGPLLYAALHDLLDAVEERPVLAESMESATLQKARQLLASLRA